MRWGLDAVRSSLKVRTRATGLLAKLAHDLELEAREMSGWVDDDGVRWSAELEFPVSGLRVGGVVRRGAVDRSVLMPSDVAEIERRIRADVLVGHSVKVVGEGDRLVGKIRVVAPGGKQTLSIAPSLVLNGDDAIRVESRITVSLAKLGCGAIRAPLGAFRVADAVEVEAWLIFVRQP